MILAGMNTFERSDAGAAAPPARSAGSPHEQERTATEPGAAPAAPPAAPAGSPPSAPARRPGAPGRPTAPDTRPPLGPSAPPAAPTRPPWPEDLSHLWLRDSLDCPRCGCGRLHKWGRFSGRQRYRCLGCRRTFSDFTGTPLAYLKRVDRWEAYWELALGGASIRDTAARLGLHPSTCFRWRHRLLASVLASESIELAGRVRIGVTWIAYSEKGRRDLRRPARRRRFEGSAHQTRVVWVVMACDDRGAALGGVSGMRKPDRRRLVAILDGRIRPGSTLISRKGEFSPEASAAAALGLSYEHDRSPGLGSSPGSGTGLGPGSDTGFGACANQQGPDCGRQGRPEPIRHHALRWKRWMRRFRGVATRYLEHYLLWFRIRERIGAGAGGRTHSSREQHRMVRGRLGGGARGSPDPRLPNGHELVRFDS
jgi:transposase-like protein